MNSIQIELVLTNVLTRWPCHVCGGSTEKVSVLAEATQGEEKGLRVCEVCLESGDIDGRLMKHAERLEAAAAKTRELVGRLKVPTYDQYRAHSRRVDVAEFMMHQSDDDDGAEAEYDRIMTDDAAYEAALGPYRKFLSEHGGIPV